MTLSEAYKVTVFGDSIGKGIYSEKGQYKLLNNNAIEMIRRRYSLCMENRSVFGQSLSRLKSKAGIDGFLMNMDKTRKNVVVLEIGGNDADFDWKDVSDSPSLEHLPKTPIEQFEKDYAETIAKLKDGGAEVITCTIVPVISEDYFENVIGKVADKNRVLEFFNGDIGTIYRHQEMYNNAILKCSYMTSTKVIDLRRKFLNTNSFEKMMCGDGIHPNPIGHEAIFAAVNEFIKGA